MSSKAAQAEKDRQEYLEYLDYLESQGANKEEVQRRREAATPGLFMQGLDKAVRVLDYAGGLVRGAGAGALELATGREDLVDIEDVLKGQAPGTAEIAEKLGVPQGGQLSDVLPGMYSETGAGLPLEKGGMLDITPRGAAGFAGDVALDPLTYLSLGTIPATKYGAKLAKATTPITQSAKKAGVSLYKSGLSAIDDYVKRYGKDPVSDTLLKHGASGSAQDILKQMDEIGEKLLAERQGILRRATYAGAEVDVPKAMAPAQAYVNRLRYLREDKEMQAIADAIQDRINNYLKEAAQPRQERLVQLPVSSEYVPSYQKISYAQPQEELINLPRSMRKEYDEVFLPTEELSTTIPVDKSRVIPEEIQQLKQSAKGNLDPLTLGAKETAPIEWQKIKIKPQEFENISLPRQAQRVFKEKYVPQEPLVGYHKTRAQVIPEEVVPDQYIQRPPELGHFLTEATPGMDPLKSTAYKTALYQAIPDKSFALATMTEPGKEGQKLLAQGLKEETEASIRNIKSAKTEAEKLARAKEAERVAQINDELGRILTSKDKQALEARKEAVKKMITPVDTSMLYVDPMLAVAKKGGDFSKTTWARTKGGKAIKDIGESKYLGPGLDIGTRRSLIDYLQGD